MEGDSDYMSITNNSFVNWVNRPFFDLGSYNDGAIHIQGIDFSYRNLIAAESNLANSKIANPVTIVHPISFRESLIRESGLFQYHLNNPLELANDLRTERWNVLCDYLIEFQQLKTTTQLKVINLLSSLCLHHAVLEYVPHISKAEINESEALAKLAISRALSDLMIRTDAGSLSNLKEFETIAHHTSLDSIRFNAGIQLIALAGKTFGDLTATAFWREFTMQALHNLKPSLDDFTYKHKENIYYRAAVFVPILQKNKQAVVQEMDLCQALAENLICESKSEVEKITAYENLTTVFESRTKEALWLGDIDLAEERAKIMVQREPLYSRYRLQLGEILIKQKKIEDAAKMYRSAARLGPPGTAIALFMAGQCYETLGELDIACDCYLDSVRMDSLAISAVERLNKLAPALGNSALIKWSNIRLLELHEQRKAYVNQPTNSYIPETSSGFKMAGEKALTEI
jgi:tetratricopeptide (TPR) repeat protein